MCLFHNQNVGPIHLSFINVQSSYAVSFMNEYKCFLSKNNFCKSAK